MAKETISLECALNDLAAKEKYHFVVMCNDFPIRIIHGTQAQADAHIDELVALERKKVEEEFRRTGCIASVLHARAYWRAALCLVREL